MPRSEHPVFALFNRLYRLAPPLYAPLYDMYKRVSDRRERGLFRDIVRPGMTVVDAGANIGSHARLLARLVGPRGRVLAFEPHPDNLAILRGRLSGCPTVSVFPVALDDGDGEVSLYVSEELNVDHRTYDPGGGRAELKVQCKRLDDIVPRGEPVHFVKMDVQGSEFRVLRGMEKTLERNPGMQILMEFWPHGLELAGDDPAEMVRFLAGKGFRLEAVAGPRGEEWHPPEGAGPRDYSNVLAVPFIME